MTIVFHQGQNQFVIIVLPFPARMQLFLKKLGNICSQSLLNTGIDVCAKEDFRN